MSDNKDYEISSLQSEVSRLKSTLNKHKEVMHRECLAAIKQRNISSSLQLLAIMHELDMLKEINTDIIIAAWDDMAVFSKILEYYRDSSSITYNSKHNDALWYKAITEESFEHIAILQQYNIPLSENQLILFFEFSWNDLSMFKMLLTSTSISDGLAESIWENVFKENSHQHLELCQKHLQLPKNHSVERTALLSENKDIIDTVLMEPDADPNAVSLANATCWQKFYIGILLPVSTPMRWLLWQCSAIDCPYFGARGSTALHIIAKTNADLYNYLTEEAPFKNKFNPTILDENGKTARQLFLENKQPTSWQERVATSFEPSAPPEPGYYFQ